MENLEQVVNAEAKHFNFKKALATALTVATFGMYNLAYAESPYNVVTVQTNHGEVSGYQVGSNIYDNHNQLIGLGVNGQFTPAPNPNSDITNKVIPNSPVTVIAPRGQEEYIRMGYPNTTNPSAQSNDNSSSTEIRALDEAIRKQPNNAELYLNKVDQQIKDHVDPAKIIETLETAINYQPKNEDAHMMLGNLYLALGKDDLASGEFKKLIELNPKMRNKLKHLTAYFESKKAKGL